MSSPGARAFLTPSLVLDNPSLRRSRIGSGQDPLRQMLELLRCACPPCPGQPACDWKFMAGISLREEPRVMLLWFVKRLSQARGDRHRLGERSRGLHEDVVDLAGQVALEAADDLGLG